MGRRGDVPFRLALTIAALVLSMTATAVAGESYQLDIDRNASLTISREPGGASAGTRAWAERISGLEAFAPTVAGSEHGRPEHAGFQGVLGRDRTAPVPAGIWTGLALLGGLGLARLRRVRSRLARAVNLR